MVNNANLIMLKQKIKDKKIKQEVTTKDLDTNYQKEIALIPINVNLLMLKL